MKGLVVLSVLVSFAMICGCQNRTRQLTHNLLNAKQNWTHARRHSMKEKKR